MIKNLLNHIKNKIKGNDDAGNDGPTEYLPFEQNGKTYNYYDLPKGFVIEGDVYLGYNGLTKLPDLSQVVVKGTFDCRCNELTSLEGAPQKVEGSFCCDKNKLTSLKGAPREIGGDFICSQNPLTSLEGGPQIVGSGYHCAECQLTSLKGAPQKVGGEFWCNENQLTSLEGAPKEVGIDFLCQGNRLTTLRGAPQVVGNTFNCVANNLTSLEGGPQKVGGDFDCGRNDLHSLIFLPTMNAGKFVSCSYELAAKYGITLSDEDIDCLAFPLEDLLNSTQYKTEVSRLHIMLKTEQERQVGKKLFRSWYEDSKKGINPKSSGRE